MQWKHWTAVEAGAVVRRTAPRHEERMDLAAVERVVAINRDAITHEETCVGFFDRQGQVLWISEFDRGFGSVLTQLAEHLPGLQGLDGFVSQMPFEHRERELWSRRPKGTSVMDSVDASTAPRKVRSAWSEVELVASVAFALLAVVEMAMDNFLWAALKLLFAVALAGRSRARDLADGVVPLIRWNPPRFLQVCFFMACGYLACWFVSYCFVVGPDFRWLNTTFKLGWTGGGDLPSSTQLWALCSTAAAGVAGWGFAIWKRHKRRTTSP